MSAILAGKISAAFAGESWVSGGATETGESWTVEMRGTFSAVKLFSRELYLGGTTQPVEIPSRNTPVICGWSFSTSGAVATLRIEYKFDASTIYSASSSSGGQSETKTESISSSVVAVSLQECDEIWSKDSSVSLLGIARAIVVDYAKSLISLDKTSENFDVLYSQWKVNFAKDLQSRGGVKVSAPWEEQSFKTVYEMLANGQDLYNVPAYQITITETLNDVPAQKGLNTYNTPDLQRLKLPTGAYSNYWYQNSDNVSIAANGQFQRVRTWLGVSDKSPLYSED